WWARSKRPSRPSILLHRRADKRAEQCGRIGWMRIIVWILVIAAAPCVTELFDQHIPRDHAAGDSPFVRRRGAPIPRLRDVGMIRGWELNVSTRLRRGMAVEREVLPDDLRGVDWR